MVETGTYIVFGSIAVSLAGFASLLISFGGSRDGLARIQAWRIRYIVTGGLGVAMASFAIVAITEFTDDQSLIVRLGMLAMVLVYWLQSWSFKSLKDPLVFKTNTERRSWIAGQYVVALVYLANFVVAEPELMLATWVLFVAAPMTIFINVVSEIYKPPAASPEASG